MVKNFNSLISTEDIKDYFKRTCQTSCSVRRFHSDSNKKPLPIISVKTNKTLTQTLLEKAVHIFDKRHLCEAYKQPVARCFSCQRFGHRANNSLLESTCENCGKPSNNHPCRDTPICVNCQGNHKPSSNTCPTFITVSKNIAFSYKNKENTST